MSKKRNIANNKRRRDRQSIEKIEISSTQVFSGPLPHPERLNQYNSVDPTFAERIFRMAEIEQKKDIWVQKSRAIMGFLVTSFGLFCSVVTVFGTLYIAYLCVESRLEGTLKWIFISTASIIGVFIIKRGKKSSRELD